MKYLFFLCPIRLLNIFLSFQLFSQHFGPLSPLSCQVFWSPSSLVLPTFFGPPHMCAVCVDFKDRGQGGLFGATRSAYGRKRLFWTLLGALWCPWMALPDPQNGSNASPGMCPDLFHPCSTLFHQFGTTRSAFGRKRPAVFGCFGPCLAALWHTHMALPDQRNGNGKKLPQKIFFSRNFSYSRQMRCFACMCKIS